MKPEIPLKGTKAEYIVFDESPLMDMIAKTKAEFLTLTAIQPTGIVMSGKTRKQLQLENIKIIDGLTILEDDTAKYGESYLVSPMSA